MGWKVLHCHARADPDPDQVSKAGAYQVAYQESLRAITQQQAVLESLRNRAGTLLSVAAIATSFLGSEALKRHGMTLGIWLAITAFVALGLLVIWLLQPRSGWRFSNSAKIIVEGYVEHSPPATLPTIYRELGIRLEDNYDKNQKHIDWLFRLFQLASILLVIEIGCWIIVLAQDT